MMDGICFAQPFSALDDVIVYNGSVAKDRFPERINK